MPQFDNHGASLFYETSGAGRPLLLIAGLASDMASWGPLPPLLTGRQLIMIDNRGCGRTQSTGEIRIADMADDCRALLDHLGIAEVDIVGHSMGGMIGLLLAAAAPERVRRIVTMTSGVIAPSKRILLKDLARLYASVSPTDFFRLLYQWLFSEPFFADERNVTAAALASTSYPYRQSPADLARQVAVFDRALDWDPGRVRCPVLALSAEKDILAPTAMVEAMHAPIAGVRYGVIAGAAHSVHWEKPAEVAAAINDFLN